MRKRVIFVLMCCVAFSACSNSTRNGGPFIELGPPSLSWIAPWVQGTQTGPIVFQSIGQNATLTASATKPGTAPPPYSLTSGSCVTLSDDKTGGQTESVTVTATTAGNCSVTFSGGGVSPSSSIQVSVP